MKAIKFDGDVKKVELVMDDKTIDIIATDHFMSHYDLVISVYGEDNGVKEAKTWKFSNVADFDTDEIKEIYERMMRESDLFPWHKAYSYVELFDAILDCKFAGNFAQIVLEENGFECEGW